MAPTPFIKALIERGCITVRPTASVKEVVEILNKHGIGAVVVAEESGALKGIVSERDIVRSLAKKPGLLKDKVSTLMTTKVFSINMDATSSDLLQIMTEKRIRHIPILDGRNIVGMVSIGDVVKRILEKYESEAEQMKQFIYS